MPHKIYVRKKAQKAQLLSMVQKHSLNETSLKICSFSWINHSILLVQRAKIYSRQFKL